MQPGAQMDDGRVTPRDHRADYALGLRLARGELAAGPSFQRYWVLWRYIQEAMRVLEQAPAVERITRRVHPGAAAPAVDVHCSR